MSQSQSWDSPILGTSPETSEANFSGWQTYRNEEYGFEIKYPKDAIIDERSKDYIRMQNYSATEENLELRLGEYYKQC